MGAKPDPYNFKVLEMEVINGNAIILANYPGCLTYEGNKLMLLRGEHPIGDTLDPHFLDDDYAVVARFLPTELGWKMARLCAAAI